MGKRLPMLKARDIMRVLYLLGFSPVRQSGSHIFFEHPDGRTTLVPRHGGEDIGRGLLRQILREIETTPENFSEYLQGDIITKVSMDPLTEKRPKVGIGVLIFKDGKVLLGKRKGLHAPNVYSGPGGHLEYMESFEDCAKRETREETGLEIKNIRFLCLTNFKTYAPKHYIDVGLAADWQSGEPQLVEPEKCESWVWYDLDNLPSPLLEVVKNYIEAHQTDKNYFDLQVV